MQFDTKHSAHLIVESAPDASLILGQIAKAFGVSISGNPDVFVFEGERMGIDEARALRERAQIRPMGKASIVLLSYRTLTTEAQNALLKLFEEPPERVIFFLVVPSLASVIPTLRSRLSPARGKVERKHSKKDAHAFLLSNSPAKRLEAVQHLIEEKDKTGASALLISLEEELRAALPDKKAAEALRDIERGRAYLFDRAPSIKLILEHLALTLPQKK